MEKVVRNICLYYINTTFRGVYYVAMLSTTALILEDKLMGLLDRSKVAGKNNMVLQLL